MDKDSKRECEKKSADPEFDPKNAVQIVVFLKMKATEYRKIADAFDKTANSFLKSTFKRDEK
jgi:hypothetical protein